MAGIQLDAHRDSARARVHVGGDRSERLGQDHVGSAMQDACRLLVPVHGHGADGAIRTHLEDDDAHFLGEFADPATTEKVFGFIA